MLPTAVGFGPLGCGTSVGFGVGGSMDDRRFEDVARPYTNGVGSLTGRTVRVTTVEGREYRGKVAGADSAHEGSGAWLIESDQATPSAQRFGARVDTVALSSIASAQVVRRSHTYRGAGTAIGFIADVTVVALIAGAVSGVEY